jgi:A/G-specific adenine glycosylase
MPISGEKIKAFEAILADFHRKAGREHLPWRRKRIGAYEIWVSEIMLQQTQVSRVISYYEKFLERFPNVESLARASWEEFLPYYQGLGYYARGRNMLRRRVWSFRSMAGSFRETQRSSRNCREWDRIRRRRSRVSRTARIRSRGTRTSAGSSGGFSSGRSIFLPLPLPRGRCPKDRGGCRKEPWIPPLSLEDSTAPLGQGELDSRGFSLPAGTLNAAMMDFGSAICTARPKCGACPLSSRCVYFSRRKREHARYKGQDTRYKKLQAEISIRKAKSKVIWKDARVFVILHENHRKYYSPYKTKFAPFHRPGIAQYPRRYQGLVPAEIRSRTLRPSAAQKGAGRRKTDPLRQRTDPFGGPGLPYILKR